jgi:hypothetical protein
MAVDVDRLLTMNTEMLKELALEDVLRIHPLINGQELAYRLARKVKPMKAKPISTILHDDTVASKIVLATLEGHQAAKANSYVCWGVDNDVWQQTEAKLHSSYNLVHVDPDGWIHCEPKDDAPRNACQVTAEVCQSIGFESGPYGGFSVLNPSYGDERVLEGRQVWLHYGILNDYILQMPQDLIDTYRVARKFFDNTYEWA